MEIHRTAIVKLDTSKQQHKILQKTIESFKNVCQKHIDYAWYNRNENNNIQTQKTWFQENVYEKIKQETNLNTGLIQKARDYAVDALESVISKWGKDKKATKPRFTSNFIAYDKRTITYTENGCSIATINSRINTDFILPHDDNNPQTKYLSDEWNKKEATLHYKNGGYYLHISVCKKINKNESKCDSSENRTVLGVDLNVTGHFAVTSTGLFLESADYINHIRNEYEKRRAKIQQRGTRSAHLTLKRIGSRFSEWSKHLLYDMANTLLCEAENYDVDVVVFEDLEGIRERMSDDKRFQQWMFSRFYEVVEYKAREIGVKTVQVDPRNTSKKCSRCGCVDDGNRCGDEFKCVSCGFELHSDFNACKNVGLRYFEDVVGFDLQGGQMSHSGGAKCQLALKSGTMNVNGSSSPC